MANAPDTTRYACCAFDHLVKSMYADVVGETKRADEQFAIAIKAYWAYRVSSRTDNCSGVLIPNDIQCLCGPITVCSCPEQDCNIEVDLVAIPVGCDVEIDAFILSGAGEPLADGPYLPSTHIPQAEPDTTVYRNTITGAYVYQPVGFSYLVSTLELDTVDLYTADSIDGEWSTQDGTPPPPVGVWATVSDLCLAGVDAEDIITLLVQDPQEGVYAFGCCEGTEFYSYVPSEVTGFDYELDSPMN